MASPTAHTLEYLRRSGFTAGVVERWLPKVNRKRDFLGCIDILACRRGEVGVLAIQATSLSNVSARVAKARGRGELSVWLAAGQRFECWGWYQRNGRWQVKLACWPWPIIHGFGNVLFRAGGVTSAEKQGASAWFGGRMDAKSKDDLAKLRQEAERVAVISN